MKKIFIIVVLVFGSLLVQAQETKASKKLKNLPWQTDVYKAIKTSNKEKKPLLLFFTGSDWCGWCMRLQKEVLKTPEFMTWAKKNVILVELDFPNENKQTEEIKAQNNTMQRIFGVQGYPTVYFATAKLNSQNEPSFTKIGSTGYVAGGPNAWLAKADGILKIK